MHDDIMNQNKIAIVTGGNRGIGLDITRAFIQAGYTVVVGSRNNPGLEMEFGDAVHFVKADVRIEADHLKLAQKAQELGQLSAYINNAGFSGWKPLEKIEESFFAEMIDTNLKGALWGCKVATSFMKKTGGSIINISSIAGKRGSSNNSVYCASKFGMNGITQSLSKELGPQGIRVNGLCPVLIRTDGLVEALEADYSPAKGDVDGFLENFRKGNCALGRFPTGLEVGQMAVFLASENASAITGQNINVDCGVFPQ